MLLKCRRTQVKFVKTKEMDCISHDLDLGEMGSVCLLSLQVSGKVAGGALCLPHVQQAHSRPP